MCLKVFQNSKLGREQSSSHLSTTLTQPVVETRLVSRQFFVNYLQEKYSIETITKVDSPMDSDLILTSKSELDRIAPELVYPADWYVRNLWDCEDYALQGQLDAGRKFGFSARLCVGWMELGYHGFLLALDSDLGLWLMENNAGFSWAGRWFLPTLTYDKPVTNWLYIPKRVFI